MVNAKFSEENLIQKPAIKILKERLGWRTTHAYDDEWKDGKSIFGRESEQQVVLLNDLKEALEYLKQFEKAAAGPCGAGDPCVLCRGPGGRGGNLGFGGPRGDARTRGVVSAKPGRDAGRCRL